MFARIRSFGARRVAVVVLASGLVGIAAVPTILAASAPAGSGPVAETSLDQATAPARMGRVLRGDVTVLKRDGSTMAVHFERGKVTAASATSVTLQGADGTSTTFAIGVDTRIRSQRQPSTASALKSGDLIAAFGTKSAAGAGYDALVIRIRPAPAQ
jgi:hypothetical protein